MTVYFTVNSVRGLLKHTPLTWKENHAPNRDSLYQVTIRA